MDPRLAKVAVISVILIAQACSGEDNGGEVGAACVADEDCADGLVCDIHDERGSCQKPHGH